MATEKISAMPAVSSLTGTELVPVVQGGTNKRATALQVSLSAVEGFAANEYIYWTGTAWAQDPGISRNAPGEMLITHLVTQLIENPGIGLTIMDGGGNIFGASLHAINGFSGSGIFTTFTIVDGVITAAS